MCMGGSSIPSPPPPPVPWEKTEEGIAAAKKREAALAAKEKAAADKVKSREKAMQGRKATILTGGQGDDSQAEVQRKTLLGR